MATRSSEPRPLWQQPGASLPELQGFKAPPEAPGGFAHVTRMVRFTAPFLACDPTAGRG